MVDIPGDDVKKNQQNVDDSSVKGTGIDLSPYGRALLLQQAKEFKNATSVKDPIALGPMSVKDYRRGVKATFTYNMGPTLYATLVCAFIPAVIVVTLIGGIFGFTSITVLPGYDPTPQDFFGPSPEPSALLTMLVFFVTGVLWLIAMMMMFPIVGASLLKKQITIATIHAHIKPHVPKLLLVSLIPAGLFSVVWGFSNLFSKVAALFVFLVLSIVWVYIALRLPALAMPMICYHGFDIPSSLKISWALTKKSVWRVMGLWGIYTVVIGVILFIMQLLAGAFVVSAVRSASLNNLDQTIGQTLGIILFFNVLSGIVIVIGSIHFSSFWALEYFDALFCHNQGLKRMEKLSNESLPDSFALASRAFLNAVLLQQTQTFASLFTPEQPPVQWHQQLYGVGATNLQSTAPVTSSASETPFTSTVLADVQVGADNIASTGDEAVTQNKVDATSHSSSSHHVVSDSDNAFSDTSAQAEGDTIPQTVKAKAEAAASSAQAAASTPKVSAEPSAQQVSSSHVPSNVVGVSKGQQPVAEQQVQFGHISQMPPAPATPSGGMPTNQAPPAAQPTVNTQVIPGEQPSLPQPAQQESQTATLQSEVPTRHVPQVAQAQPVQQVPFAHISQIPPAPATPSGGMPANQAPPAAQPTVNTQVVPGQSVAPTHTAPSHNGQAAQVQLAPQMWQGIPPQSTFPMGNTASVSAPPQQVHFAHIPPMPQVPGAPTGMASTTQGTYIPPVASNGQTASVQQAAMPHYTPAAQQVPAAASGNIPMVQAMPPAQGTPAPQAIPATQGIAVAHNLSGAQHTVTPHLPPGVPMPPPPPPKSDSAK